MNVDELFDRALDLEGDEREAFLATCGARRADVEKLLEAHAAMGDFLDTPAVFDLPELELHDLTPGAQIGQYTVEHTLGRGGGGTVYAARQDQPRRLVALKVMKTGLASESAVERFRAEAEIVARLRHPGIAHVYEAGVHGALPYFAMEHVEGEPFGRADLGLRRRLAQFTAVCDAVHHGHVKGVIHRDLKPANVLVDADGRPKVIDFGIAQRDGDPRALAGTPAYMSPEQFEGGGDIDARSDVYSLGVMLYEIVEGSLPYEVTSITDAARIIPHTPPRPPRASGDLGAVIAKALAKNREDRYGSAAALGEDVQRVLRHEAVAARRASWPHLLHLFVRRRTGVAVALLALLVAVAGGVAFSLRYAWRAEQAREQERRRAYAAAIAAADGALRVFDVAAARRYLKSAPEELRGWEWRYLDRQCDQSATCDEIEGLTYVHWLSILDGRLHCYAASGLKAKWIVYDDERAPGPAIEIDPSTAWAFSEDGKHVAFGSYVGHVTVRGLPDLEFIASCKAKPDLQVKGLVFLGEHIAAFGLDKKLRLWRWRDGELAREIDASPNDMARVPGGLAVAVGDEVRFLDAKTLARRRTLRVPGVTRLAANGTRLATSGTDRTVRIWEGDRVVHALRQRNATPRALAWKHGLLVAGYDDGTVTAWDPASGEEIGTVCGHADQIESIDVYEDGTVVTGAADATIRTWRFRRRSPGGAFYRSVAWSGDGKWIALGCLDGGVDLHDADGAAVDRLLDDERIQAVAFTPDGSRLVCGGGKGEVWIFDTETWEQLRHERIADAILSIACTNDRLVVGSDYQTDIHDLETLEWRSRVIGSVWYLGAATRGGDVFVAAQRGQLARVRATTGDVLWRAKAPYSMASVAPSPDGRRLVTHAWGARARVWNAETGGLVRELPVAKGWAAVFSPDGGRIALGGARSVALFDAHTFERVLDLRGFETFVYGLAFSPDGTRLAAADGRGNLRVFDAR